MHTKINFTGIFSHYQPINFEPHYVFKSGSDTYLINCKEHPELISELSPDDLVNIEAEKGSEVECGTTLVNVKFGRLGV